MKKPGTDFDALVTALQTHPEGISIQEVAGLMGIHRNTAAKYLEVLQSQGEVDVRRVGVSKLFIPGKRIPFTCVARLCQEPVIGVDRDLNIAGMNNQAAILLGKSEQQLIGVPIWMLEGALGGNIIDQIREVLKGRWYTWEQWDRSPVQLIRGIPVKYCDNRTGAAIVLLDPGTTEGIRSELNRYAELVRLLTQYQTEYIIRLNPDLTYAWVNPAYAHLFNLAPENLVGNRLSMRVLDDEMDLIFHTIRNAVPEGSLVEYRLLLPSGDIRHHQALFKPLPEGEKVSGYIGVIQDVTDFKLKEEQFLRFYNGTEELLEERTRELRELNSQMYREIAEREQIEETLRSVEFAVQHVTDMIIWFDPSGRITYTNHSAREKFIPVNPEPVVKISSILHESPSGDWDSLWDLLREKKTFFLESLLTLPDNSAIPAEILFNYLHYGNHEYCCCVARDIHERKQAMAELIESENRFRQLASIIPEVFYLSDLKKGALLYINPAFEKMYGRSVNEIYQNPNLWKELIHPEDRDRVLDALSDSSQPVREVEGRMIHSDGSIRWAYARIFSVTDANNRLYREVGVISDITEQKKIGEELKLISDRFLTTLKATPVSIFNQDSELRYIWIGQSSLGFSPTDLLGKTDHDIFPPDVAERLTKVKRKFLHTGEGGHSDVVIDYGGRSWTIRMFIEPFRDLNGIVAGITVASIDLTDLIKVKEALHISEKKYRCLFNETNDISIVFTVIPDRQGLPAEFVFEDLNRRALTLIGRKKPELIGRHLSTFRPDIDPQWFTSLRQVAATGEQVCFEGYSELFSRHISVNAYSIGDGRIGVLARDISDLVRAYQQVEFQRDLALSLSATTDLDEVLHLILQTGMQVPGIDSGGIYFFDDNDYSLHLQAHSGMKPEFIGAVSIVPITPAIEDAYNSGMPIYYSTGAPSPARTPIDVLMREGLNAYVALPILNNGRFYAVLNLGSHTLNNIPILERPYLESLAAHLGETLARVRHESELSRGTCQTEITTFLEILDVDGKILEGSAPYDTHGYAPVTIRNLIQGEKELLYTGQEVSGMIQSCACSHEKFQVRVRFIPWGREVAYLAIGERFS